MSTTEKTRMIVLRSALRLELSGMKMSRGRSVYSIIKEEFSLKGNKQKVYERFNALCVEKGLEPRPLFL